MSATATVIHASEAEFEFPQVDLEYEVAGADALEPAVSDKEKSMFYVFKVGA